MIKTIYIDSHKLLRVPLSDLLTKLSNLDVIHDIGNLNELPKEFNGHSIELVIIDPTPTIGIEISELQNFFPNAKIIVLTRHVHPSQLGVYIKNGVSGLYSKEVCPTILMKGIEQITSNPHLSEVIIGPIVRQVLIDDIGNKQKQKIILSERESQILELVCLEKTNSEISGMLQLSIRTIETHRRRMIEKSGSRSIIGVIMHVLILKN